jgi:hypothetical protein
MYKLVLQKGFALDSSGIKANASESHFRTKQKSDYGFLTLYCKKEAKDIIELLKNDQVIALKNAVDTIIHFPLLVPGDYQVRILHDQNVNGKWDTGLFFNDRRQPEQAELFPGPISIKANWENKIDLKSVLAKKPSLKK